MDIRRPNDQNPSRKYVSQQLQFRNPYFPRTTPKETRKRRAKIYFWLALVVLAGLAYLVAFSGFWRISNITVTGATPDHERMIRDSLSDYLQQRRVLFLPGDNGWLINPNGLSQTLLKKLEGRASFESFNATKPNLKKIVIMVKERTAAILWQVDSKQYFLLDNRGVVFSPVTVSEEQPAPDLPLIKNIAKATTTIGAEIITAAQAETIIDASQRIKSRFSELKINYATPIIRESVRTVCIDEADSNSNNNSNSNSNRNGNTNSSTRNANIRPANVNSNSNTTSDTNNSLNSNTEAPCETKEVPTGRYAREVLINVAKDTDIYFSADELVDDQINAIGVLLNEKITDINKVSYIDVRYLPRAYYK
ncbi:MAG: hypothetical protein WC734_00490 [Patescibacteria group bacterium]|jgi:hypothetical protein